MPNKLDPNKRRVSYAEDKEVLEQIKAVMEETGESQTDIIRKAVSEFLERRNAQPDQGQEGEVKP